jgi:hypothetical protein
MSEDMQNEAKALAAMRALIGRPIGAHSVAPDPVNLPMIRHWATALEDRNPVYRGSAEATATRTKSLGHGSQTRRETDGPASSRRRENGR